MTQKASQSQITIFAVLLGLGFMTFGQSAEARRGDDKFISITSIYSLYNDVSLSSSADDAPLAPSLDVEASFRFKAFFNFSAILVNFFSDSESTAPTEANQLRGYGIGFKIDLPGIFFVGERTQRFATRTTKRRPFNSFIYGNVLNLTTTETDGVKTSTIGTKYGLGLDTFLFNKVAYMTLTAGGFLFDGNSYLHYGAGLGFIF